jgi:hypothetical protein
MMTMALALLALLAVGPVPESPAEALTRGRLESDLGHHAVAATAFLAVTRSPEATTAERWEALVRLGAARRESGDAKGAVAAFEETWRTYGRDPEALRFLLQGMGSALPGAARWREIWPDVRLDFAAGNMSPGVRALWPGATERLCPCSGAPIDVSYKDQDLQDVFRAMADTSRLNIVVQPGSQGTVTYEARQRPWDEVLESVLAANGLIARRTGNVVWIGRAAEASPHRSFTGKPISVEFRDAELKQVLREIAAHGPAEVEFPEGLSGRVWIKLDEVPWDQAFDLLVNVNGLVWTRRGNVFVLSVKPRLGRVHEATPHS